MENATLVGGWKSNQDPPVRRPKRGRRPGRTRPPAPGAAPFHHRPRHSYAVLRFRSVGAVCTHAGTARGDLAQMASGLAAPGHAARFLGERGDRLAARRLSAAVGNRVLRRVALGQQVHCVRAGALGNRRAPFSIGRPALDCRRCPVKGSVVPPARLRRRGLRQRWRRQCRRAKPRARLRLPR